MLDRVLLRLQCPGLVRHMFGQRVQRGQALLGALAQLLQLGKAVELGLDLAHGLGGCDGVGTRALGAGLKALDLLAQFAFSATQRGELALERADVGHRPPELSARVAQLRAQLVQLRAFFLQRAERGLRFLGLRAHGVERLAMLLQFAVGRGQRLRHALGLGHLALHLVDAFLELVEGLGALVEAGGGGGEPVHLLRQPVGLLAECVQRLAGARELGRRAAHLCQQRAERRTLVARLDHQGAQLVMHLAAVPAVLEDRVQHFEASSR